MKKNFIYNVLYQILILIIPLITMPYVSRTLGADGIGIYSYTYSIAYYFMIIAMLGLNNYGNRTIAKVRDNKEELSKQFCSIYAFQLISSLIMIVAYLIYIFVFDNQYKIIAIIQAMYVISSMFDINWFFFGIEKFKLTITRNTIIKVLSLILIFIFIKTPNDVWKYTVILAGSTLFSNIVLFSFLRKYIKLVKVSKKDVFKHFKPCLVLFLPVIAVSIYKIMDKIMLGSMSTVKEVGSYENAEKITQVPISIITALGTVMLPRVSNMLSNNQEEQVKKTISKTMPFIMFLTFPMILGLILISKEFSIIFLGNGFEKSGYLIQLLSITIVFLAWGNVIRTQYLIPKEMDKQYIISAFLGALVNFILNCIFIPIYQSVGACIGTIAAEFIVMFYQTFIVRKELPIKKYIIESLPFLLKALIMFVLTFIISKCITANGIYKLIVQVIFAGFIYLILNIKYIYKELEIFKIFKKIKGVN